MTTRRAALRRASNAASDMLADTRHAIRDAARLVRGLKASPEVGLRVGMYLVPSILLLLIGVVLLCLTAIQLLIWGFPNQPAWVAYGEVTLAVLFAGIALGMVARKHMKGFEALKQESAALLQDVAAVADHAGDTVEAARDTIRPQS